MKKKFLPMLLALVMVLGMVSVLESRAEAADIWNNDDYDHVKIATYVDETNRTVNTVGGNTGHNNEYYAVGEHKGYPFDNRVYRGHKIVDFASIRYEKMEGAEQDPTPKPTPTADGNRHRDASGKTWLYEETRTAALECSHKWDEGTLTIVPTCTENGEKTFACTLCGETKTEAIEELGHNYSPKIIAPTCTEYGYTTYTCTVCGENYIDDYTEPLEHEYESEVTAPSCVEYGYTTYTCTVCGGNYIDDYTEPLEHEYESEVTAPSCVEYGYTTYTCTVCGENYIDDYTEPLEHEYESEVTAPNCVEYGYTTYTCTACGWSYASDYTDPLGHEYESAVTAPTCTEDGYTTYTCACGDSYIDNFVYAVDHEWDEGTVILAPTCNEYGRTAKECTACGEIYTEYTEPLWHKYDSVVTAPSCISRGYTTYTCTACGWSYVDDITEPHGHKYDSVVTAPTCTEEGCTTHTCSACGYSYTENITEVIGHNYEEQLITAPTTEKEGEWLLKCTACGSEKTTVIPKLLSVAQKPVNSHNLGKQNYTNYTETVKSYLNENEDGGYTRVEYVGGTIYVEEYDRKLNYISSRAIEAELELFGGYYTDGKYHFIVFGQANDEEDNNKEIMRIVRYSEDWYRIDSVSVSGIRTTLPFGAGALRMCAVGDFLYIATCHRMYTFPDGLRHQTWLSFIVRMSDMSITAESHFDTAGFNSGRSWGYVSHSFNQFIAVDNNQLLAVEQGDAYPRSLIIFRGGLGSSPSVYPGNSETNSVEIIRFQGETGDNYTGASVGGFEISDTHYLVAGNSMDQSSDDHTRNIFVAAVSKEDFTESGTSMYWFTSYNNGDDTEVSTPHLVKLNDNSFCLLWTEKGELRYIFLNSKGEATSKEYSSGMTLSDCKPIVSDGKILWYVTENSLPRFYNIDSANPDQDHEHVYSSVIIEPDCTEEGYTIYTCTCGNSYTDSVVPAIGHKWDKGKVTKEPTTSAEGEKTFTCTVCSDTKTETIDKLTEDPKPADNPFTDVAETDYYFEPVMWAVENGVTSGLSADSFGPAKGCTRAQVVTFLWRAAGEPAPQSSENPFKDIKEGTYYYDAVLWAVENGVTSGLSADTFGPDANCNRGQIVTFLWRAKGKPAATNSENPFKDVPESQYYYEAVLWAVEKGITTGLSADSFGPNSTCTRGQIVTFLYRAYQ